MGATEMINGWVIPSNAARAVGRFRPEGPIGYRADVEGAIIRPTRAAAVADWIADKVQHAWTAPNRGDVAVLVADPKLCDHCQQPRTHRNHEED